MSLVRKAGAAVVLLAALAVSLPAQNAPAAAAAFDLSIDNIMRGPELYGTAPTQVRFSDDSRFVYFRWRKPGVDTADALYRVAVDGTIPELIPDTLADSLAPSPGEWSRDRRLKVFAVRGDLYLWDASRSLRRRLTHTPAQESNPSFSPDGRTIYFAQGDNLFALSLEGASLTQLTDVRRGAEPRGLSARDTTGQRGWLRGEQRRLFEFIRRPPDRPTPRSDTLPKPFYLGERQAIRGWDVSPDGRRALATIFERAANAQVQTLPVWVSATGYIETQPNRTKVGDEQGVSKAVIIDLPTGAVTTIDVGLGRRPLDVNAIGWSRSGRYALLRGTAKDDEDRWLWTVEVPGNTVRVADVLHDSAWVGGLSQNAGWLGDADVVWFTSERSGWAHLYSVPAAGAGQPRALTAADRPFEVRQVSLGEDGRRFLYHSSETHFGEQHCYSANPDGQGAVQLTHSDGREDCVVSPDQRWLAVLHSTANHPPELYLQPNRDTPWRKVTESTTEEFRRYAWRVPELVMVPARDGARVPARLYRPARANGAAVIFVHGAGYLQNAHKYWSSYSREYMFHHLLTEHGYVVLDMDYRASAGLGRDWRTGIYRFMGGKDLTDNVDGARWLVQNAGVDSARIGIYGGSYGGFITLMAMFTTPGTFAAGAALRPVTDWAHYNHGYTAAILNEPQDDSIAYRRSSPIYFAEGLRGHLLIAHGMVDDNVNFQDAVRLVQRLIELRKENWELAVYPVEPHGFRMASSWADEYKRIFRLFETNLRR